MRNTYEEKKKKGKQKGLAVWVSKRKHLMRYKS